MKSVYIILLFIINSNIIAQDKLRVVFYNVENLFDTTNNTATKDDEFTEDGSRHWTNYKYWQKVKKISKTLRIIGEWNAPSIIGLAEIENDTVLKNLVYSDPLKKYNYKILHRDSPDRRGIDTAILYREDRFFPLSTSFYHLKDNEGKLIRSREIIHSLGIIKGGDSLHIFVVHFPSRYGGYKISEPKRIMAVTQLLSIIDSVNISFNNPKIIVMGDFNDTPNNNSIIRLNNSNKIKLLNNKDFTHKYQSKWSKLDHFFVSKNLLDTANTVFTDKYHNSFMPNFIIMRDEKHLGIKPYRTFIGFKYIGGFSDHLPIFIDLTIKD